MKFIEVLKDGLTVERTVRMAGDRIQVTDAFKVLSKKKQAKLWGAPRYREITQADFEGTGGEIVVTGYEEDEDEVQEVEAMIVEENPFVVMDGLDVEATLEAAVNFTDEQTAAFIEYERDNANRVSVLDALGAGSSEN